MDRPSLLLRLIVVKKLVVASLLLAVAGLAAYGYRNYEGLAVLAEQWGEGDRRLLLALTQRGIDLGSHGLQLTAELSGLYGLVVLVAAVATWRGHRWGEVLFAVLLAATVPLELIKVLEHLTALHLLVLLLTLVGLAVVVGQLRSHHSTGVVGEAVSPR